MPVPAAIAAMPVPAAIATPTAIVALVATMVATIAVIRVTAVVVAAAPAPAHRNASSHLSLCGRKRPERSERESGQTKQSFSHRFDVLG